MGKEELKKTIKDYENAYTLLNASTMLVGETLESKDIYEMNHWLFSVIGFYKKLGIDVTIDDFVVPDTVHNAKNMNKVIKTYMEVFANNLNNLDSEIFLSTMFKTLKNDVEIAEDEKEAPIFNDIRMGVMALHLKNKPVFMKIFEAINETIDNYGYEKVNFANIGRLKNEIASKMNQYKQELNKILEEEEKVRIKKQKVDKVCTILTRGGYREMTNDQKQNLYDKLPKIIEVIVRFRIFDNIKDDYLKYSWHMDYDSLLGLFKRKEEVKAKLLKRLNSGSKIIDVAKKSKLLRLMIEKRELSIQKKILECDNEMNAVIEEYFGEFYHRYNINVFSNEFSLIGMNDKTKLFGVFDFDKIPLDSTVINEMDEFKQFGLKMPNVGTYKFKELSILALDLMNEIRATDKVKVKKLK